MKRILIIAVIGCAMFSLGLAGVALGNGGVKGDPPSMMVSPQTIVLSKIAAITVHTNIPAVSVDSATVTLNDVPPIGVWADDCGDLAARFAVADLALEPADEVVLTLRGAYIDEVEGIFAAEDVVRVKK